jgi:hypothetical protein
MKLADRSGDWQSLPSRSSQLQSPDNMAWLDSANRFAAGWVGVRQLLDEAANPNPSANPPGTPEHPTELAGGTAKPSACWRFSRDNRRVRADSDSG